MCHECCFQAAVPHTIYDHTHTQEPDDLFVARNTPTHEAIIGVAGDTVREPRWYIQRTHMQALHLSFALGPHSCTATHLSL